MYDYLKNSGQQQADREKAVYDKLLAQYNQLLFAATEGVYEVTVRSQSGAIVIPVSLGDGTQVAHTLAELFSARVDKVEDNLNTTILEVGSETESELNKKWAAKELREEQVKENLALIAQYNAAPALAQQAATPAPKQAGPGRPKKVKLQPELVGEMAGLAAQVPMNHGSTGNAAARATNLPQA